ncbi:glycosylhydrolase-like jelly roll fold domain-containing protein [Candidatus Hydrogenedentota bacterium]
MLDDENRLFLDLGEVAVIAEGKLNGKDLGTLWKPPLKLDVTRHLKTGKNAPEVAATNLWVNRLIGDAGPPQNIRGKGKGKILPEAPEWVRGKGERSADNRYSWTAYKYYAEDSPLVKSGLLGPVQTICGVRNEISTD